MKGCDTNVFFCVIRHLSYSMDDCFKVVSLRESNKAEPRS